METRLYCSEQYLRLQVPDRVEFGGEILFSVFSQVHVRKGKQNITRRLLSGQSKREQHSTVPEELTHKYSDRNGVILAFMVYYCFVSLFRQFCAVPCSEQFLLGSVFYRACCSPLLGGSDNPEPGGKQGLHRGSRQLLSHQLLH